MELKIAFFIIVISVSNVFATPAYSQVAKVSLNMENKSLEQVMDEIERQSEFYFIFNQKQIDVNRVVDIQVENKLITDILPELFKGTNVNYAVFDRKILLNTDPLENNLLAIASGTEFQQRTISGTITGADNEPLVGVTVVIKGTSIGTLTDVSGKYTLTNVPLNPTLVFTFIGMTPQEIIPLNGQTRVDVIMKVANITLEEVVVVGYGSQRKETVTGAIASVTTQKLLQSPQANISNTLSGRMSGLLSVQPQGIPGNDQAVIHIRGQGTFSGSANPLVLVDGIENLNYNNIDPNEIETITILKDASATAVYGVRGANGVLIIITKRGKVGRPQIGFTSSYAMSKFTGVKAFAQGYDYALGFNTALKYESFLTGIYTPKYSNSDLEHYKLKDDPIFYPSTNWVDLMLKPLASQNQTNLNISGGTERVKYFVSAGYFSQGGLFNNTTIAPGFDAQIKFERTNIRSNFDFDITKRLTAKIDMSSQIEQRTAPGASVNFIFERMFRAMPLMSPGIVDGKVVNVYSIGMGNPLEQLLGTGTNRTYTNYLNGSVKFNYLLDFITKGLSARLVVSYQNMMQVQKRYTRQLLLYMPKRLADGSIVYAPQASDQPFAFSQTTDKNRKVYLEYGFDYTRTFGAHNFTGLLLYNQSKFYSPSLDYLVPNGYEGLVGRVTYNFSKRYLAEFDFGYNGTENFAPGKRFGFFPAYSLGWVVSEENFFPKNNFITFLKLRGSYGEVGNDKIGGSRFVYRPSSYSYSGSAYWGEIGSTFQSYVASVEGVLGNPNLTWERAKKTDIGIDATLWEGKIKLTTDWFVENRNNILAVPGTLPITVGISFPARNMGRMKNSGIEGDVTYNNKIGRFEYFINANFTYAHNVVKFQDEVVRPFTYQYRTGQRFGQFFGYIAEGFYNTWEEVNNANRPQISTQTNMLQPGDLKFKDVNGDGIINSDDQVPIGYSNFPEKIFGVSFGGNFKGFDISILFQGASNVSVNYPKMSLWGYISDKSCINYLLEKGWTQERYEQGLPIDFPHLGVANSYNNTASSWRIVDGSYLRLKNAEIGYAFTGALLKKLNIGSIRFYINGYNLLTFSKMLPGVDPEIMSPGDADYEPYPTNETVNMGLNIKF